MTRIASLGMAAICAAGSAHAQPSVTDASIAVLGAAVNTDDLLDDYFPSLPDPSVTPVSFSETASVTEPFTLTGTHSAAAAGEFEAIGDQWVGEGSLVARFAEGLDPTQDVPGSGVGATTFASHRVSFTLAGPTPVRIEAGVTANFFADDDAFDLDGLGIGIDLDDGTDVFDASLNDFATSGMQTLDQQIVLPAGSYEFSAIGLASTVETLGVDLIAVNYAFTVTFIPAPTSAALLGLAGLTAMRRRR